MYNRCYRNSTLYDPGGSLFLRRSRFDSLLTCSLPTARTPVFAARPGETPKRSQTKPNEAKLVRSNIMSKMREKFRKRSQMSYPQFFQGLRNKKRPFLGNNERPGEDANCDLSPGARQQVRPKPECRLESAAMARHACTHQ